jgi:AcrR family transcriptional regulator
MSQPSPGADAKGRRGRAPGQLDRTLDPAILDAALNALSEHGYDRTSMDDVASRAGVGKAAIYRRWSSKETMVAEAIAHWRRQLGSVQPPNTGSLRGDVEAIIAAAPELDENDLDIMYVVIGVATAACRSPRLAAALDDLVLSVPRRTMRIVLDQASARGEISADRDLSLIPDALMGVNFLRIMTGRPVDRVFVRRALEDIVLPLATSSADG